MPVYIYFCSCCQAETEVLSKITEKHGIVRCAVCGKEMERIIAPTNFVLKGGGWAKDSYQKKGES